MLVRFSCCSLARCRSLPVYHSIHGLDRSKKHHDPGDYDGRTALHLAVAEGQTEIVRVLLNKGAKVDVVDRWNATPLLDALNISAQASAEMLITRGAKLQGNMFQFVKQASETDSSRLSIACLSLIHI